jgi:membrane-associated protease RseP (regulator of RpoE activity)
MPILRQHALVLLLGLCALMVVGTSPSACGADATGIPPLVLMREILSQEAYAKASKAILETMDREKLKVSHCDVGIGIDEVSSGSQGERIGLRKGDIIIAIDGNPILTDGEFRRYHAVNHEQEMKVLTPGVGERAVKVMPGKIGINLNEWTYCPEGGFSQSPWMLETSYLNGPGRDPRFDDDMLVACASAYGDGDLCETALARVQHLGGHPEPFFYLACVNGYHKGRFDAAIAYGETALASAQGEGCSLRVAQILCELCINSDHMDRAQELLTGSSGTRVGELPKCG